MSTGQFFIDNAYEAEDAMQVQSPPDNSKHTVTTRLEIVTVAFLDGLAERFGTTRAALAASFVQGEVFNALRALNEKDVLLVSESAQKSLDALLASRENVIAHSSALSIATFARENVTGAKK